MKNNFPFTQFLKQELNALDFENLHQIIGSSKYRLTTLLKGQEDWYLSEIGKLAKKLEIEPLELIMQHGLGWKYLSLKDVQEMATQKGEKLALIANAA